jgi:hypothetical protein
MCLCESGKKTTLIVSFLDRRELQVRSANSFGTYRYARVCSRGQASADTSAQTLQLKKASGSFDFFSATKQERYSRDDGKLSSKSLASISSDERPWYLRSQPVETTQRAPK